MRENNCKELDFSYLDKDDFELVVKRNSVSMFDSLHYNKRYVLMTIRNYKNIIKEDVKEFYANIHLKGRILSNCEITIDNNDLYIIAKKMISI